MTDDRCSAQPCARPPFELLQNLHQLPLPTVHLPADAGDAATRPRRTASETRCDARPAARREFCRIVRQLNNVRRLIGNRASNCFWSMKPASPAGVWFCSARMPPSRISALAGGMTLKKSFRSPFIHRRLCAKQRPGGCVTHAGFQKRLMTRCRNGKCPLNLSNRIREAGKSVLT